MEEIVGADAIRAEILDDARKKASRLLSEGEDEAARNVREIETKASEVVGEIFRESAAKSARYRMETMARFPLERTRMRTTFVDSKLREEVAAYVEALPPARVVALSEEMLVRGAAFFDAKDVELRRKGIGAEVARKVSERVFAKASSISHIEDDSLPAAGFFARTPDDSLRIRATMDLVEERLLDEKRGALAEALCAEALGIGSNPDDGGARSGGDS